LILRLIVSLADQGALVLLAVLKVQR